MRTFVDRGVSRGQRGGSLTVVNLSFLDRRVALVKIDVSEERIASIIRVTRIAELITN
jgi:hypothetical protein